MCNGLKLLLVHAVHTKKRISAYQALKTQDLDLDGIHHRNH